MDEEVAHVHAGLPEVPPQDGDLAVLVDVVAINFQVLVGDTALDAVCFGCREHEHGEDRAVARPQHGAFTQTGNHSFYLSAAAYGQENTMLPVWRRPGARAYD